LIDAGAQLEVRDEHGDTALSVAVTQGHVVVVQTLFGTKAVPFIKTQHRHLLYWVLQEVL